MKAGIRCHYLEYTNSPNTMPVPVIRASYITAHYGYRMTIPSFHCAIRPWPAPMSCGDCAGVAGGRRDMFVGGGVSVPWARKSAAL